MFQKLQVLSSSIYSKKLNNQKTYNPSKPLINMRKLSSEVKAGAILLFLAFVVLFISSDVSAIYFTTPTNCQQSFSREASFNTQYYLCGNQYTATYYNPYTYLQPSFIYPYNPNNYNIYLQHSFIKLPNINSSTNIYTTNQRTGLPYCGDGIVNQGFEQCDLGAGNGKSCPINTPYGKECRECSVACGLKISKGGFCGDGIVNGPEECDGGQLCNAECKLEVECTFDLQCDDLDLCTRDFCDLGVCKNELLNIDDNNLCTIDSCDFNNGIKHEPVNTDDLDICTDDICLPNAGVFNLPIDPSDGDLCTLDSCDTLQGISHQAVDSCFYFEINFEDDDPQFESIEDEFPADTLENNENEEIEEVECFQDNDCTDSGQCSQVSCISGKCEEKERTGICNDENECTFNDLCLEGMCNGEPIENILESNEELSCNNVKELRFDIIEKREDLDFRIDNHEKDNILFLQGKDTLIIEMKYDDSESEDPFTILIKDFSLELNDEKINLGDISFECKYDGQASGGIYFTSCLSQISEDTLEKLDEAVKETKSANLQIKIGNGNEIEIVKEGYTHTFEDKGTIYSNYNGFTKGETIYFPEQFSKKYIARNIRNKEAFEDKPIFFVSSNNWKDILSVESLANWKSSSSEEEWCVHPLENKEKCSYPTLIYSSSDFSDLSLDDGIIDTDYIDFINNFGSKEVFIIEEENSYNDETLKDILEEKGISSSIISLPELYEKFFKSYGSFIYSENYNDALQGTLLSSYLNIPFVATEDESFDDLFESGVALTIGHFENEKIEDNQNKIYYHENENTLSLYEGILEKETFENGDEARKYISQDKISPKNPGIIFINSNDIYSSYCENTNKNGKSFYGLFCKSSLLSPEISFMNDWPIYNIDLDTGEGFLNFQKTSKEIQGLERDERATERAETAKALIETSLENFKSKISSNNPKDIFYLFLGGQKAIPYFRTSIAIDENNKVHLESMGNYPSLLMGEDVPILVNFNTWYILDKELEEDTFEETDRKSYNVERIYGATPLSNSIFISQTHLLNYEENNNEKNCENGNCAVASHPYQAPKKYLRGLIEGVRAFRLFRMFGLLSSPSEIPIQMNYPILTLDFQNIL